MTSNRYTPVRLHYDKYVPDNCNYDLSPIIFLHGMMSNLSTWKKVKSRIAFKTKRQVYALDLRNHGESECSDECSVEALTADLEYFMGQEGIIEPVVVGHSLGGKAACNLALRKPGMLRKIILEDVRLANPKVEEIDQMHSLIKSLKRISRLPSSLTEKEAQKFVCRLVKYVFPLQPIPSDDFVLFPFHKSKNGKFCFDFNREAIEKSCLDTSNYILDFKKFQKFPGPALFIFGAGSLMKVDQDELIPEFFQNVQFCEIKGSGHMPHSEVFEEFVNEVSKFINDD